MSEQLAIDPRAIEERRVRIAKTVVLFLACVVGVTLVTALVFGVYNYTTDKPAKAMFQGD